jgi:hypothetical protein
MTRETDAIDKNWRGALAEFDAGNRQPLANLVATGMPITAHARGSIADIVAGRRKPDGRGLHRRKWSSPASRELAVLWLSLLRELRDAMLADAERIERTAGDRQCEADDVRKWINAQYQGAAERLASDHGVSLATLKDAAKPSA